MQKMYILHLKYAKSTFTSAEICKNISGKKMSSIGSEFDETHS